jgi:type III secretion protein D
VSETAVLRVLSGRLAGTTRPLPETGTVSIGHQFWQDVVIRDPQTKGMAVDLSVTEGGQAQITVLSGEAQLLGQTIDPGGTAILPPYVPFSIGGVSLAWGEPESERWSEAGGLVLATSTEPEELDARAQAVAAFGRAREGAAGLVTKRTVAIAAGAAALAIGGVAAVPAMDALGLRAPPAARVDRALDAAGLAALAVAPAAAGDAVTVTGVVTNEGQRVKAQEVLRDSGVSGTVDVQTSNEIAQAAADVARGRGLQANARAISRTAVELRTSPLSDEARFGLVQAVRADVRQIGPLRLRDDLPAADEAEIKAVSDLTRKVSTVVAGDPAFIQTADGARYFSGAVMPSGHRLIGIEGSSVYLEKNGRKMRVQF